MASDIPITCQTVSDIPGDPDSASPGGILTCSLDGTATSGGAIAQGKFYSCDTTSVGTVTGTNRLSRRTTDSGGLRFFVAADGAIPDGCDEVKMVLSCAAATVPVCARSLEGRSC